MSENEFVLSLETPLGGDTLRLQSFRGEEGFSRLFEFELEMVSTEENVAARDIVGQAVTFGVGATSSRPRHFHGYVRRFSAGEILDSGMRRYRATVVPWLWFLTKMADCRIFQNQTIPEILETVLSECPNNDFELNSLGSYPTLEYCVQYRESTFQFVSRLLEEAGIFYFFRFEEGRHQLVLANATTAYFGLPEETIRFSPGDITEAHIQTWDHDYSYPSGKFTLRDYDFESPSLDLTSDVTTLLDIPDADKFEVYDYPGRYLLGMDGDTAVRGRMEAEESQHERIRAQSDCSYLATGGQFKLDEYDHAAEGGAEFLVTAIRHQAAEASGGGGEPYRNEFRAVPSGYIVRPPLRTPRGRVHGPQTAVVVGPAGEEIYTDEHGRIKVQFHWDRVGASDAKSSCWIRVAQSLAGAGWGGMQLPRIGQEVVIEFLEGDPDRPLVTGGVYNGNKTVPEKLPENKTRSILRTVSSPGGGGHNELHFEDKAGSEKVYLHAQKDMETHVLHDEELTVDHERTVTVKANHSRTVTEGNETVTVQAGSRTVIVNSDHTRTVKSGDEKVEVKSGGRTLKIAQNRKTEVGGEEVVDVEGDRKVTLTTGSNALDIKMGDHETKVALGEYKIQALSGLELQVGGSSIKVTQTGIEIKGMMVKIEGQISAEVKGVMTKIDGSALTEIKGGVVMIN